MTSNPNLKPVYISKSIHKRFKAWCVDKDTSMADQMELLIKEAMR